MKRKLLLVFLTLSIFNLYAASAVRDDVSRPLLAECKNTSTNLLRIELNKLKTPNDWKDWIKAHGTSSAKDYLEAIEAVAEYVENESTLNDLCDEIFVNSSCCFCFGKSKFINFFFEVRQKLESRKFQRDLDELKATFEVKTREVEDLRESLKTETEKREALETEIKELRIQRTVKQTSAVDYSESDHTEVDMTKVSESFASQIEKLHTQFEELKALISAGDLELASQIQSLSEKVDAMDLEGIRADVEKLAKEFSEYKEGAISPDQFDAFTIVLLALRKLADPNAIKVAEAEVKEEIEQS